MTMFLPQLRVYAAVSKEPKVVEPKCKIQPTSAGEDKIMFVRTS
ncbi:MAG: hypothetical protein V7K97_23535 [Nostoc sp.]